jgi:hypothetical protein
LNPYARGYFRPTVGEEGLAVKIFHLPVCHSVHFTAASVGFGRLNQMHPHAALRCASRVVAYSSRRGGVDRTWDLDLEAHPRPAISSAGGRLAAR